MAARSIAAMLNFLFVMALADSLGPEVRKFVRVDAPKIILEHVEVIDGTGAAPRLDQSITIEGGKITAIGTAPSGDGATVLDLTGYAVIPGIVGMHDHLWYQHLATPDRPAVAMTMTYSAPRLYLANGVTTMRTAASVDP
jgi:imidazolonepropionase-like amidohydrolase